MDAIAPKRETAQREMERRIVAQMLTCLDDLAASQLAGGPLGDQAQAGDPSGDQLSAGDAPIAPPSSGERQYRHVVVIGEPLLAAASCKADLIVTWLAVAGVRDVSGTGPAAAQFLARTRRYHPFL